MKMETRPWTRIDEREMDRDFGDSLKKNDSENKAKSQRKVAIFAGQTDDETEEVISISQSEEKPYIIAIVFFDTHLQGTENECYSIVWYVIPNT